MALQALVLMGSAAQLTPPMPSPTVPKPYWCAETPSPPAAPAPTLLDSWGGGDAG